MAYKNLSEFLELLEKEKELARIKIPVNPNFELGSLARFNVECFGPALLFENVIGTTMPVVVNLLSSRRRLALLFQCKEEELVNEYIKRSQEINYKEPIYTASAPCKEIIIKKEDINLYKIPQIIWNVGDAGPYITFGVVRIKDCLSNKGNLSVNRIQIIDKDKLAIFTTEERDLGKSIINAWKCGKAAEVVITIGYDPLYSVAAVDSLKTGIDEILLAGALRNKSVEVVRSENFDIEIPAQSEIVIEGIIEINANVNEGPFLECFGVRGIKTYSPLIKVKTITQKKSPIYIGSYSGKPPVETTYIQDFLFEAQLKIILNKTNVDVKEVYIQPTSHVSHVIISIKKRDESDIRKLIRSVLPFAWVKRVTIVDDDINVKDLKEIDWAITTWFNPEKNLTVKSNFKPIEIDCSVYKSKSLTISKMVIDATRP